MAFYAYDSVCRPAATFSEITELVLPMAALEVRGFSDSLEQLVDVSECPFILLGVGTHDIAQCALTTPVVYGRAVEAYDAAQMRSMSSIKASFITLIGALRMLNPDAHISVLGVIPRFGENDGFRQARLEINDFFANWVIKDVALNRSSAFIDASAAFSLNAQPEPKGAASGP